MEGVYRESIVHGAIGSRHVARLFDSLESRADAVSSFIADALSKGHHVLMLTKPLHWDAIAGELVDRGCAVERARQEGSLTVLDAKDALEAVTQDGYPSAFRFDSVLGTEVARLSRGGELSVYGELVDLLAERGDFRAAVRLEGLWNRLSERCSFTLLCGYSAAHFVGRDGEPALREVCALHGRVHSGAEDPLGQWMLRFAN